MLLKTGGNLMLITKEEFESLCKVRNVIDDLVRYAFQSK